jgi:hypothetical protein
LVKPNNSRPATLATFSALSHHEEIKDTKAWDGDVAELQMCASRA